ncbi:MAG: hypothetical protein H6625_08250 [Bdellovibrionaceae bacterium]|nr:hypothetical protein [Pseudobdellovibrionaceae bacterium]
MTKLLLLLIYLSICFQSVASSFSFHLLQEPHTLDPISIRGSTGSYLFTNLFRSLYRYHNLKGLIPEGAEFCVWKNNKHLNCKLNRKVKWSQGDSVKAQHYVNSFQHLINPKTSTVNSELILNLKNASLILKGKKKPTELGIKALGEYELDFYFDQIDPDFLYKLSYPSLAPIYSSHFPDKKQAHKLVVNGPYKIKEWVPGKRIYLERNSYYANSQKKYPEIMVYFIEDDETALRVFESNKMSFLRRLNSSQIENFRVKKGFFQVPVARFDYMGFGPELKKHKAFRKALALSLDYEQLKKIYHALGRPGCPSMPSRLMKEVPCYPFDLKTAKEIIGSLPVELKKKRWPIYFSKMGGDDIAKGMEWMQHQWQSHLGLQLELKPEEQGVYLQILNSKPPAIFRKGLNLDRPTCLAGLETFLKGHPENFIQLDDIIYKQWVQQLENTQDNTAKQKLCSKAIQRLMDEFYIIPLGEMHFTMLEDGNFTGWSINEFNQLDLTDLQAKTSSSK